MYFAEDYWFCSPSFIVLSLYEGMTLQLLWIGVVTIATITSFSCLHIWHVVFVWRCSSKTQAYPKCTELMFHQNSRWASNALTLQQWCSTHTVREGCHSLTFLTWFLSIYLLGWGLIFSIDSSDSHEDGLSL